MPELPEVEFARQCLTRWLRGKRLERATASPATRVLRGSSEDALRALEGHRIEDIERRGKWLLWKLSAGAGALAHLGMTGRFVWRPVDDEPRWSRVRLEVKGGAVHFVDPRMFGRLLPGGFDELAHRREWRAQGPDAWDETWTPASLRDALGATKSPVKVALMDQAKVAGLGNIQATEALWRARLHPGRPPASLDANDWRRLVAGIRWTLERTLADLSGDEITYVEEDPSSNPFLVYAREGEPCPRCSTTLEKLTLAGRTTIWCPACQPVTK